MSLSHSPSPSFSAAEPLKAGCLAGLLLLGAAVPALAGESTVEMKRIHEGSAGPAIGQIQLADKPEGLSMTINLNELPPGPNRIFLYDAGDCSVPRGEQLSDPLATVNVGITESGAEALRTTLDLHGKSLETMAGKTLVVYRGSQAADAGPQFTSQPRLVACGEIR
jgi:hypothetical protein